MSRAAIRLDGEVLRVSGELTFASVTDLLKQSRPLLAGAGERIAVDLEGVERADSAGLAMLIEWMRLAADKGSRISFLHLPEQMQAIAEVSDLDDILPLASESA